MCILVEVISCILWDKKTTKNKSQRKEEKCEKSLYKYSVSE